MLPMFDAYSANHYGDVHFGEDEDNFKEFEDVFGTIPPEFSMYHSTDDIFLNMDNLPGLSEILECESHLLSSWPGDLKLTNDLPCEPAAWSEEASSLRSYPSPSTTTTSGSGPVIKSEKLEILEEEVISTPFDFHDNIMPGSKESLDDPGSPEDDMYPEPLTPPTPPMTQATMSPEKAALPPASLVRPQATVIKLVGATTWKSVQPNISQSSIVQDKTRTNAILRPLSTSTGNNCTLVSNATLSLAPQLTRTPLLTGKIVKLRKTKFVSITSVDAEDSVREVDITSDSRVSPSGASGVEESNKCMESAVPGFIKRARVNLTEPNISHVRQEDRRKWAMHNLIQNVMS